MRDRMHPAAAGGGACGGEGPSEQLIPTYRSTLHQASAKGNPTDRRN